MKLSKALKVKNRLVGELNRLNGILRRENARRSDSVSKVDRQETWGDALEVSERLGVIKAQIAEANVPIYSKLERMTELKSRIAFIESLDKREGEEVSFIGRDQEKMVYTWDSFINQEEADRLVAELQEEIEALQDEVDDFNAVTTIDFEE